MDFRLRSSLQGPGKDQLGGTAQEFRAGAFGRDHPHGQPSGSRTGDSKPGGSVPGGSTPTGRTPGGRPTRSGPRVVGF
jgi:hypothetical protein